MVDYIQSPEHISTHFEYVIHESACCNNQKVKQIAIPAKNQLEGWCTDYKASVLIDLVLILQPSKIVEIGVFGGKSLVPMAFALQANKKGVIYGIDPWDSINSIEGMVGAHKEWWGGIDHQQIFLELQKKISEFGLEKYVGLIKATSEDCPPISDIDILHIDGNHSEKTSYIDVTKWVPFVRKGGLIIFDDVNWETTKLAVEWIDQTCIPFAEFKYKSNVWKVWVKSWEGQLHVYYFMSGSNVSGSVSIAGMP